MLRLFAKAKISHIDVLLGRFALMPYLIYETWILAG